MYQRGDSGRAWVTNEEQAALGRAGLPTRARMVQGHGVLTTAQYNALKKAGSPIKRPQLKAGAKRHGTVRVAYGEPVPTDDLEPGSPQAYQEATERLMERIYALYDEL